MRTEWLDESGLTESVTIISCWHINGPVRAPRGRGIFLRKAIRHFSVTWHCFHSTGRRIAPQRVGAAFTLEIAAVLGRCRNRAPRFTRW